MLKKLLFASALVAGAATALPPDATALGLCGEREVIVGKLKNHLGEVRVDGAATGWVAPSGRSAGQVIRPGADPLEQRRPRCRGLP
jgi:hypothetical protein